VVPLTWHRRYHRSVTDHTPSVASDNAPAVPGLLGSLARTVTADGTDLLGTREEAVPWLRAAGLLPDDAVISGSEHGALLRLRDALVQLERRVVQDGAVGAEHSVAEGRDHLGQSRRSGGHDLPGYQVSIDDDGTVGLQAAGYLAFARSDPAGEPDSERRHGSQAKP